MATTDARISTGLPSHPKMKKLVRRLGAPGGLALLYLFLWAAGNRSDGDLAGMTDEDIELAVDWTGDAGKFATEAAAVGFLDGEEGARCIHDWAEHNPYAAGAEDRSERSRFAALCRRYGREEAARLMPEYAARLKSAQKTSADSKEDDAISTPPALPESANGMPPAQDSTAPYPVPLPVPLPVPVPVPVQETPPTPQGGRDRKRKTGTIENLKNLDGFERWYALYRRKVAKQDALKAWVKLDPDELLQAQMIAAVKAWPWASDKTKIPHPASWIKGLRWNDEDVSVAVAAATRAFEAARGQPAEGGTPAPIAAPQWWQLAGFDHPDEARNFGCYDWNASEFRDGKRLEAAA